MKTPSIATGARSIIATIIDLVVNANASPDIQIELHGSKLVLSADLGGTRAATRTSPPPIRPDQGDSGVTPELILTALEKRPAGYNLIGLSRYLGVARKVLKPVVAKLLADGALVKVGTLLRLPGAVALKRGRRPNSAKRVTPTAAPLGPRRAAINAAVKPKKAVTSKPRPPVTRPKPIVPRVKPAPSRPRPRVRKPSPAKRPASTPPPAGTSGTSQSDDPSASLVPGVSPGGEAGA